jgi:hypothetical protein
MNVIYCCCKIIVTYVTAKKEATFLYVIILECVTDIHIQNMCTYICPSEICDWYLYTKSVYMSNSLNLWSGKLHEKGEKRMTRGWDWTRGGGVVGVWGGIDCCDRDIRFSIPCICMPSQGVYFNVFISKSVLTFLMGWKIKNKPMYVSVVWKKISVYVI